MGFWPFGPFVIVAGHQVQRHAPDLRVSAKNGGRSPSAALLSSPRAGCLPLTIVYRSSSLRPAFLRTDLGPGLLNNAPLALRQNGQPPDRFAAACGRLSPFGRLYHRGLGPPFFLAQSFSLEGIGSPEATGAAKKSACTTGTDRSRDITAIYIAS